MANRKIPTSLFFICFVTAALAIPSAAEQADIEKFYLYIAQHWLDEGEYIEGDLNEDFIVNLEDFSIFASLYASGGAEEYCMAGVTAIEYRNDCTCPVSDCTGRCGGYRWRILQYGCYNRCTGWFSSCSPTKSEPRFIMQQARCTGNCQWTAHYHGCSNASCGSLKYTDYGTPEEVTTECGCQ